MYKSVFYHIMYLNMRLNCHDIVVKTLIYHGLLKQTKQVHRYFSGGTFNDLTQNQTQRTGIFKKNVEKTKHILH